MSHTDNQLIEKFSGEFEKEETGCSILINSTINSITNLDVLGLYSYLACRPPGWKIHPKHLIKHFKCSKDKIYRLLSDLIERGLLIRTEIREKGRYKNTMYKLLTKTSQDCPPPCPDLPDTATPDTEKPDAYKTNNVLNKEEDKTLLASDKPRPQKIKASDYEKDERFMRFYKAYPVRKKGAHAYKMWLRLNPDDDLLETLLNDVQNRLANDSEWIDGYIPHPGTYLNPECPRWKDEIVNKDKIKADNQKKRREAKEIENAKRLAEQERLSKERQAYEAKKHQQYNQEGQAYRNIAAAVATRTKPAKTLKEMVAEMKG